MKFHQELEVFMKIHCDETIFKLFPEAGIHGVVVDGVDVLVPSVAEAWKLKALQNVQQRETRPELLVAEPEIQEWRNAYQKFGVKPSKYRSSIELLLKRALKGDLIQTRIPLVNLYCYVSIIGRVPMGAYDWTKLQDPISIRSSEAGEEFLGIGERQVWKSDPGMVVYSDQAGIICWAGNHRDSARTCLDQYTQKAIVFADSAVEESRTRAEEAIALLSEALAPSRCAVHSRFVLDRDNLETEVF
jgi:DNA/RNA-binding domain of Phe-tRNA-synthetase-like protein